MRGLNLCHVSSLSAFALVVTMAASPATSSTPGALRGSSPLVNMVEEEGPNHTAVGLLAEEAQQPLAKQDATALAGPLLQAAAASGMGSNVGSYVDMLVSALGSADRLNPIQENDAAKCFFNDMEARDQFAHIERTYTNGRFAHTGHLAGQEDGKVYCAYKGPALQAKGWALDSSTR